MRAHLGSRVTALVLLLLGSWACGDSTVHPNEVPEVHVDLTIDRVRFTESGQVTVIGVVWNSSVVPALTWDDGCGIRPILEIRDPLGSLVRANSCMIAAPPRPAELGKESRSSALTFDGRVWSSGEWVPAPVGEYRVTAEFWYWNGVEQADQQVRRESTFVWTGE